MKRRKNVNSAGRGKGEGGVWRRRKKGELAEGIGVPLVLGRLIAYGSIGGLILLLGCMLLPVSPTSSFALCTPDSSTSDCTAMPISTEVGVTTNTVISLAIANQVNLELTPKSTGATATANTKLAVSTNSNDGYALYLQTGREDGSLTGVTSNLSSAITNTEKTGVLIGDLELNSYGYALSQTAVDNNTTYSRVPTTSTVIKTTHQVGETTGEYSYGDTYYLAFGTKIGTNLPAGQYAGTVTVSAVANPTTLRSMYDLTYMQDMTSDICENTKEHYTKQLIDTRDGKSYWVAKLKDGNCWMVQNLALDITEAGLKASDTDISEDWNQNSTYPPVRTQNDTIGTWAPVSTVQTRSWNLGQYIAIAPLDNNPCESTTSLKECETTSNLIDVTNEELWKPTYQAQNGTTQLPNGTNYTGYLAAIPNNTDDYSQGGIYDAHYLFGNYYFYNATTAGNAAYQANTDIIGSICPKGWKLPFSSSHKNNISGSFYYLINAYGGIEASATSWESYNLGKFPFYFTRPGAIESGKLSKITTVGLYNAATVGAAGENYYFEYKPTNFVTSNYYSRVFGRSVRCLAR